MQKLSQEVDEREQLDMCREYFGKYINFKVFTQFFRTFCVNKYADHDFLLRASAHSFAKGITYWYGGRPNPLLS